MGEELITAFRRPKRGREFGTAVMQTPKVRSESRPASGPVERDVYHEGFMDGKMYLVPDSTLEAMKDMVNLTMRPRKSLRYRHQTSADVNDDILNQEKIDRIMSKLEHFDFSMFNSSSSSGIDEGTGDNVNEMDKTLEGLCKSDEVDKASGEKSSGSGKKKIGRKSKADGGDVATRNGKHRTSKDKSRQTSKDGGIRKSTNQNHRLSRNGIDKPQTDADHRIRILISGHFKNERPSIPIFVIQKCKGNVNVFENQEVDFKRSTNEGDVFVSVLGKMYNENILDECESRPVALNVNSYKFPIDKERKIFVRSFEHTLKTSTADITLSGEFKRKTNANFTPSLTIVVKPKTGD